MKRNTIQRQLVLDTVRRLKSHASAEEIYVEIAKEHPTVSRGTVYRNLNGLADDREIQRVEIPGQADRYDHTVIHHHHICCTMCGACADICLNEEPDFIGHITDTHGFEIEGCDVVIKGLCPACREKHRKTDSE